MAELTARALALSCLLGLLGCDDCSGCEQERTVPFKREASVIDAGSAPDLPTRADAGAPQPEDFQPRQGRTHPQGTHRVPVGALSWERTDGSFRASLSLDLNGDGNEDGMALRKGPEGRLLISAARVRDGAVETGSDEVLHEGEGCTLRNAGLSSIAKGLLLATAELECLVVPEAQPAGTESASSDVQAHLWVLPAQPAPRALAHLSRRVGSGLGLTVSAADRDGDGHADLQMQLSVADAEQQPQVVTLAWLNRPSGLARERDEPEKTVLAMADAARRLLKSNPAQAQQRAEAALQLHGALCRESGRALLGVGSGAGLECGVSSAAGRAASVRAAALARQGRIFDALEAMAALNDPALQVGRIDQKRLEAALADVDRLQGLGWKVGPQVRLPRTPDVRRSALQFLDGRRLLVHSDSPFVLDIQTGQSEPMGTAEGLLLSDPAGRLTAVALARSCQGTELQLTRTEQIVGGMRMGPITAQPLLIAQGPLAGCPNLSPAQRREVQGVTLLDWSERGVLAAHGGRRYLLALDAKGVAKHAGEELTSEVLLVPTQAGPVSADGRHYALLSPMGLVIAEVGSTGRVLPLPDGDGTVSDIALAPSAQAVALIRGGRIHIAVGAEPSQHEPPLGEGRAPLTPTTPTGQTTSAADGRGAANAAAPGEPAPATPAPQPETPPSSAAHAAPALAPAGPGPVPDTPAGYVPPRPEAAPDAP